MYIYIYRERDIHIHIRQPPHRGKSFEVLGPSDSTMYLGRLFCFGQTHDREIQNRMNKAWAKFAIYRKEFTDRYYDLEQRIKLFQATVQPTLLYGCSGWTLTWPREAQIRMLQRVMLRIIIGTRRLIHEEGPESWVKWIIRSTRVAEQVMSDLHVPDWVEQVHRRKFRWAGCTARTTDGRWTREVFVALVCFREQKTRSTQGTMDR